MQNDIKPLIVDKTYFEHNSPDSLTLSQDINDYPGGIVIPVDKPYRWTSADVIRKIKYRAIRHFGKKKLKVGHAGTLDPLATGTLLVCIGNATKLAEKLQASDKEYIAGIMLGATTPSYDMEKEIDRLYPYEHITEEEVRKALEGFIGEQDQVAPLFSAKSVDGVRAYEIARKLFKEQGATAGFDEAAESVIRTSRITISRMELIKFGKSSEVMGMVERERGGKYGQEDAQEGNHGKEWDGSHKGASSRINVAANPELDLPVALVRIECSKGTYVRAVARDLGEALGSGAHLCSLRRSRSGDFRADSSADIDQALSLFLL